MKTAKTIDEQIEILRSHGIIVNDECKAKEILHDIGYYRLGFYFFPFDILAKKIVVLDKCPYLCIRNRVIHSHSRSVLHVK